MWVIIGAASGLGSALYRYKAHGTIIGTSRQSWGGLKTLDPCNENDIISFVKRNGIDRPIDRTFDTREINLIHCAGLSLNGRVHKQANWDEVMKVNLTSAFLCAKHFLPLMQEDNYGRIVFCGSVVPRIGVPGTCAYSAAKAGLLSLAKSIAVENGHQNITANVLELGYFDEGMGRKLPEDFKGKTMEKIPARRFGSSEEFIRSVEFLVDCGYVNGSLIPVTGGL